MGRESVFACQIGRSDLALNNYIFTLTNTCIHFRGWFVNSRKRKQVCNIFWSARKWFHKYFENTSGVLHTNFLFRRKPWMSFFFRNLLWKFNVEICIWQTGNTVLNVNAILLLRIINLTLNFSQNLALLSVKPLWFPRYETFSILHGAARLSARGFRGFV